MSSKSYFSNFKKIHIIAEIGINHNGDIEEAKKLILAAKQAGADSVKVQVRDLKEIYTDIILKDPLKAEQGTQHMLNELKKVHLDYDEIEILANYAQKIGITFFGTPFDYKSARFLNDKLQPPFFKIGSPDFTNLPLLDEVIKYKKPIILSTGMSNEDEIIQVIDFLKQRNVDFCLLHCNSTYPAAPEDINLNYLPKLQQISGNSVGYSGHEQGYAASLAAVALGAIIIERHITFDTQAEGLDHSSSLNIKDFKKMACEIRLIETVLGESKRIKSQGEIQNFLSLGKSIVTSVPLKKGDTFTLDNCVAKTPAKGISPLNIIQFLNKTVNRNIDAGEYVYPDLFSDAIKIKETFDINKHWGIVGRLNDYQDYLSMKPDLIEIHMTWRDVVNYKGLDQKKHQQDLVVHAPEYYQDKLIDFTSEDPVIKELSIEMLRSTINVARDLNKHFKGQTNPRGPIVVVHPGGHLPVPTKSSRAQQYSVLLKNLKNIDTNGVRVHVENMPPFPWYFGGQWYNTIFMNPSEIADFANESGWKICYDLSHALLYCNKEQLNIKNFSKIIMPHIGYLHISDAAGVTNEGLQLGTGNLDLEHVSALIQQLDVGFIPEIWQGHLNKGHGFKEALITLEKLLKNKLSTNSCSEHHKSTNHCRLERS